MRLKTKIYPVCTRKSRTLDNGCVSYLATHWRRLSENNKRIGLLFSSVTIHVWTVRVNDFYRLDLWNTHWYWSNKWPTKIISLLRQRFRGHRWRPATEWQNIFGSEKSKRRWPFSPSIECIYTSDVGNREQGEQLP